MKTLPSPTSVCRFCRYYEPEGRRGGHCQQLNVAVQSAWTACSLAISPFSPAWESIGDIIVWQQKTLAAMQSSSASAMTEALSEVSKSEASSLNEAAALPYASKATRPSLNGAIPCQGIAFTFLKD